MIRRLLLTVVAAGAAVATGTISTAQDIKIGIAGALSGDATQCDVAIRDGFQLAADEINAAGGINGSKIVLAIESKRGKKEEAINVFKKLILQGRVAIMLGPTLSNSTQVVGPITQVSKTAVFGVSNIADSITNIGDFTLRSSMTEADVLPVTIRTVVEEAGVKGMATLYGNSDVFTESDYDNFKKTLEGLKIPATTAETLAKDNVDFKARLTRIRATNPDAIMLSMLIVEDGPVMVQARQLGLNVPIIDGSGMNSVKVFGLTKDKSDNLWVGSPWSVGNRMPGNNKFIIAYTTKHKATPDQFAAQVYDVMYITSKALKTTELSDNLKTDRKTIHDALPTVKYTGATGTFAFRQVIARGKPADYGAVQTSIVSMTKNGKHIIEK